MFIPILSPSSKNVEEGDVFVSLMGHTLSGVFAVAVLENNRMRSFPLIFFDGSKKSSFPKISRTYCPEYIIPVGKVEVKE